MDQKYVRDFYKITALIDGTLDLKLDGVNSTSQLNVYDNQLNLLSTNVNAGQQITTQDQQYFIKVISNQSTANDYQLTTQYAFTEHCSV